MSSNLRGYAKCIAEATGETDEQRLAILEDMMRDQTGGVLDSVSRRRFNHLARRALEDLAYLEVVHHGGEPITTMDQYSAALLGYARAAGMVTA